MNQSRRLYPQIKVCGLTRPDEAKACADLGADAIGLVFYPPSPRNVTLDQARDITTQLPSHVAAVGVFVNADPQFLLETIHGCGLHAAQLHGNETPENATSLGVSASVKVIKALFTSKPPGLDQAGDYNVNGFLVECGQGRLPGGNAETWDWSLAEPFGRDYPLILAGGLTPDNVCPAIHAGLPDAVDASSGLEAHPGRKDLKKVEAFIAAVQSTADIYTAQQRAIHHVF